MILPVVHDFFDQTAASIIACYEATGTVQPSYDEEGRCSDDAELSAWTLTSSLPREAELTAFTALDSRVKTVGTYAGTVSFYDAASRLCRFGLKFTYSGEDILVETDGFQCP